MAFTLSTTILPILIIASSAVAQNLFDDNNDDGGLGSYPLPGFSNTGYPSSNLLGGAGGAGGAGGGGGFLSGFSNTGYPSRLPGVPLGGAGPGSGFPSFGRPRRAALATVYAENKVGDKLYLSIEEQNDNHYDPSPGGRGSPFVGSLFGQNVGGRRSSFLRVHGLFMKSGATTGVPNPESLHGQFAMVVTTNGNTHGYCVGTGRPYRLPSPQPIFSPFNPFSQYFQQRPPGQVVLVTTPLYAKTGASTVEGQIRRVRLSQIVGRSIHVCADTECRVKTDLCGIIGRDDKTIEEFKQYLQQHNAQQIGAGGVAPYNPFPATGGTGLGTLGTNTAGVGTGGVGGTGGSGGLFRR